MQGLLFDLNFGDDAVIQPNQKLVVKGKTDPLFVNHIKLKVEAQGKTFDPAEFGFSQVNGEWWMTMEVNGPYESDQPYDFTAPKTFAQQFLSEGGPRLGVPASIRKEASDEFNQLLADLKANPNASQYALMSSNGVTNHGSNRTDCAVNFSTGSCGSHKHSGNTNQRFTDMYNYIVPYENSHSVNCGDTSGMGGGIDTETCYYDIWFWHYSGTDASQVFAWCRNGNGPNCATPTPAPTPTPATVNLAVVWASDNTNINSKGATNSTITVDGSGDHIALSTGSSNGASFKTVENKSYTAYANNSCAGGKSNTVSFKTPVGKQTMSITRNNPKGNFSASAVTGGKNASTITVTYKAAGKTASRSITAPSAAGNTAALTVTELVLADCDGSALQTQNSSAQASTTVWTDIVGGASKSINWNQTNVALPYSVIYNSTTTAAIKMVSNDATVPADQQPATKWNGQAAKNAKVDFTHAISSAPNKGSRSDARNFTGINGSVTSWGVRDASGTVTATVSGDKSLSGSATYQVQANTVNISITADLPVMKATLINDKPANATNLKMRYSLDGVTKVMSLASAGAYTPSTGAILVRIPVEDALTAPKVHNFQLLEIFRDDDNNNVASAGDSYRAIGPDNGGFGAAKQVWRTNEINYGSLDSVLLIPKFRLD